MHDDFNKDDLLSKFMARLVNVDDANSLQALSAEYLGSSGCITNMMRGLASVSLDAKRSLGPQLNQVKASITDAIAQRAKVIEEERIKKQLAAGAVDCTLPARYMPTGSIHPISFVIDEAMEILVNLGFECVEGPEIEDDFHNFSALNTPEHHPARQMQSTFYLSGDPGYLLRTQTSNAQIRTMLANKPPLTIASPGRVFRRDFDATHTPMFHQIEGLCVREEVSVADLRSCLESFMGSFFGSNNVDFRFRPSYFPFTAPSMEVDIKIAGTDNWLEILGCGMVHPNVLRNVGIDPGQYMGFAFGVGVERLAMLKYGISDIRNLFDSNLQCSRAHSFSPAHYMRSKL